MEIPTQTTTVEPILCKHG